MSEKEEIEWVKEHTRQLVRAGFDDREDIIELVQDHIYDDGLEDELSASQLVDEEISNLEFEQKDWPDVTDNDRLELVFQNLMQNGVLPRHNFTCCGTCGVAEIYDEIEAKIKNGTDVKGYVFYHQQDTESAVDGHGLYFNYGAVNENASDEDHIAIGKNLSSSLRAQGFEVDWDNSLSRRIGLKMDWKRRWGSASDFLQLYEEDDN